MGNRNDTWCEGDWLSLVVDSITWEPIADWTTPERVQTECMITAWHPARAGCEIQVVCTSRHSCLRNAVPDISRKPKYNDVYRRTIEMSQCACLLKVNCCLKVHNEHQKYCRQFQDKNSPFYNSRIFICHTSKSLNQELHFIICAFLVVWYNLCI